MGNQPTAHNLYLAITAGNEEAVANILLQKPELVNQTISDDGKSTPATRAAFLGKSHILLVLIKHGVDLNITGANGISALMWAAGRGHLDTCKLLVEFGANLQQTGIFEMNAADMAVLYGYYNTAFYLRSRGLNPTKQPDDYSAIKTQLESPWVDYAGLLMSLDKEIPVDIVPAFTLPPIKPKVVYTDPVPDPTETWKDWLNRVKDFENPPLVERHSLPAELQPQNRVLGKLRIKLGIDKPPIDNDRNVTEVRPIEMKSVNESAN